MRIIYLGLALLLVSCASETETKQNPVEPPPPPKQALVEFLTKNSRVMLDETIELVLKTENTLPCTLSWDPQRVTSGSWNIPPTVVGRIQFVVSCPTSTRTLSDTVSVEVESPPNPTHTLTASQDTVRVGEEITVQIFSENAVQCVSNFTQGTDVSGLWTVQARVPGRLTLSTTCSGRKGTKPSTSTLTVIVLPNAPTVVLTANPQSITVGQQAVLEWTSSDASNCSAPWTTSTAVSGSRVVSPTLTTRFLIVCEGLGGRVSASVTVTVSAPPVQPVRGKVVFVQSGPTATNLRVKMLRGSAVDSADVQADGSFSITPGGTIPDSVEIQVNMKPGTVRQVYPSLKKISRADVSSAIVIPLTPVVWKNEFGNTAGTSSAIQIGLPFAPNADATSSFFPRPRESGVITYYLHTSRRSEPVFIAFDRVSSNDVITAQDSASISAWYSELGAEIGYNFRMTDLTKLPTSSAVKIRLQNMGWSSAGASYATKNGQLEGCTISAFGKDALASKYVMKHELMHCLGLGHTCSWQTLMSSGCFGNASPNGPTATDISYFEVHERNIQAQQFHNTSWGLAETHQAYKVLILGEVRERYRVSGYSPVRSTNAPQAMTVIHH